LFKPDELIKRLSDYVGVALGHVFWISHVAALNVAFFLGDGLFCVLLEKDRPFAANFRLLLEKIHVASKAPGSATPGTEGTLAH
jgi:hypothetical protein